MGMRILLVYARTIFRIFRAYLLRPLAALHLLAVQDLLSASARLAIDLTR
jgi:hypothetical protein